MWTLTSKTAYTKISSKPDFHTEFHCTKETTCNYSYFFSSVTRPFGELALVHTLNQINVALRKAWALDSKTQV